MHRKEKIQDLSEKLLQILEAKDSNKVTLEDKERATLDIWKLVNHSLVNLVNNKETNLFHGLNELQEIYFHAINKSNKLLKCPSIEINNNLFRVYCCTLFSVSDQREELQKVTGWNIAKVLQENITLDMKKLILYMINAKQQQNSKNETN